MTGVLYYTFTNKSKALSTTEETMTMLIGGHNTGLTEVSTDGICTQYKHSLPATYRSLPDGLLYGPRYRYIGVDKWLPSPCSLVSIERSIHKQEGGWEWREDRCDGKTWQYWWVPDYKLDEFIADREDQPTV
jgi:hypothetical protein